MPVQLFWSAKAGLGCSTALAITASDAPGPTLLVDLSLAQDLHCVLGAPAPPLVTNSANPATTVVREGLHLVGRSPEVSRTAALATWLHPAALSRFDRIFIDYGVVYDRTDLDSFPPPDQAVQVMANSYLSLRASISLPIHGRMLLVEHPGAALTRKDVTMAVGPVTQTVPYSPEIARLVDAGLLGSLATQLTAADPVAQ